MTTHMRYFEWDSLEAMMLTGIDFQLQIEYSRKNYSKSFMGLWLGNTWQILATKIAHEIPPKYPIPLEEMARFLAHTLTTLKVSLKFSTCFPVSSKIIRLFFRPRIEVLLLSSSMESTRSLVMTFSMSLGTVSVGSWQKLISISVSL